MRRRFFYGIPMLLICIALFSFPIYADMGPKPSVVVEFTGAGDREYYVTLVAKEQDLGGPYHPITEADESEIDDISIWNRFVNYGDPEDLRFAGRLEKLSGDGTYQWSYLPPDHFRILVYFPDTGSFAASSELLDQYAFDSYYQVNLDDLLGNWNSAVGTFPVTRKYNIPLQATAFLLRLAVTVAIESLLAVLFGFHAKRQLLLIVAVNCVSQLVLNLLLLDQSVGLFFLYVLRYALLEVGVILLEGLVYCLALPGLSSPEQNRKLHPIAYAVIGNIASFTLGYLLSNCFPMVFS